MSNKEEDYEVLWEVPLNRFSKQWTQWEEEWRPTNVSSTTTVNSTEAKFHVDWGDRVKGFLISGMDTARQFQLEEFELGIPGIVKAKFKRKK